MHFEGLAGLVTTYKDGPRWVSHRGPFRVDTPDATKLPVRPEDIHMGIFGGLGRRSVTTDLIAGSTSRATQVGPLSPWQTGNLAPIVAADVFGLQSVPMTRLEAMRVPAVVKARAVLHATIGSRPLRAMKNGVILDQAQQPTWLYRSNNGVPPRMRNKLTLDDHIFNEASLWKVTRGAGGQILDALHIPYDNWAADENGKLTVYSKPVSAEEVLWIPGPGPGLIVSALETIRGARSVDASWVQRATTPYPAMTLQESEDLGLSEDEVKAYLDAVVKMRRDPDRAVMWLPYNINLDVHAAESTDMFESGRNAQRIDFANFFNMPTSILDGSVSTSTLTYSTQEGKRNEFADYTIPYWSDPFEDRLSLDDVVPAGTSVAFDLTDWLTPTASPTGPTEQD